MSRGRADGSSQLATPVQRVEGCQWQEETEAVVGFIGPVQGSKELHAKTGLCQQPYVMVMHARVGNIIIVYERYLEKKSSRFYLDVRHSPNFLFLQI